MSRAFDFIEANIRTIGIIYLVVAVIVFVVVLLFFLWIARAEDKERELYSDDEFYYQGETTNMIETILFALLMATGCAILWVGIPLILMGVWIYERITKKFPELTGHMADDIDNEMEEKE